MATQKKVSLKVKGDSKRKTESFPLKQANAILSLTNSAWELSDTKYKWNGTELTTA